MYQLPALVGSGFTLVVSPLISLMHDQVRQLRHIKVSCHSQLLMVMARVITTAISMTKAATDGHGRC